MEILLQWRLCCSSYLFCTISSFFLSSLPFACACLVDGILCPPMVNSFILILYFTSYFNSSLMFVSIYLVFHLEKFVVYISYIFISISLIVVLYSLWFKYLWRISLYLLALRIGSNTTRLRYVGNTILSFYVWISLGFIISCFIWCCIFFGAWWTRLRSQRRLLRLLLHCSFSACSSAVCSCVFPVLLSNA